MVNLTMNIFVFLFPIVIHLSPLRGFLKAGAQCAPYKCTFQTVSKSFL